MSIRSVGFVLVLITAMISARATELTPDFAAAHTEVVSNLKDFVRINTSSPPGDETKAAKLFQGLLSKENIESEIFEKEVGRGNLVARIKGNGKKKPIILMGHTDVVGVEREKWSLEPFDAVEKDGYLYGRGTLDDKSMTTVYLEIVLLLKRLKVPLDRDVIFIAEAGEEGNSTIGMDYLVDKHWDKIEAEYALNEGGGIFEENGRIKYVAVSTGEKVPRPVFLASKGVSGHASRPRPDNAIVHLAAAVAKIGAWQPPLRFNETTRLFFQRLATVSPPGEAWLYTHIDDPKVGGQVQEIIRQTNYLYNSMLRTSISPTILKGGFRSNVIPGDALATLDVRALPDEDMKSFVEAMRKVIDDPAIDIVQPTGPGRPATPPSPIDSELFAALEHAQQKVFPGSITLPQMDAFATDSAQIRAKGVKAYGLTPVTSEADSARMHGNDERIKLASFQQFLQLVWTAVVDVAATK
ncbi:MAG TPA: M20/M25/M40 family metallo-hydrolase [Opitutaceae bacterium]|nr:M20/M25/M40 family metallo-hydrolase [Opitutaceae bacterium]